MWAVKAMDHAEVHFNVGFLRNYGNKSRTLNRQLSDDFEIVRATSYFLHIGTFFKFLNTIAKNIARKKQNVGQCINQIETNWVQVFLGCMCYLVYNIAFTSLVILRI